MLRPPRLLSWSGPAALCALLAAPARAQAPAEPPTIGAFFHSTEEAFAEDIARVDELGSFGLTTWLPAARTQADLDAWMRAAEAAGANVIFKFLGDASPVASDDEGDDLNLDRFARVCRMTVEAEDSFAMSVSPAHGPPPTRVTDADARAGVTAEGDVGNAVLLPAGAAGAIGTHPENSQLYWLRRCNLRAFAGTPAVDSAGVRYRNERLRVRLRVDETLGPTLAELRATNPDAMIARIRASYAGHERIREIRVRDLESGVYTVFDADVPFYRTGPVNNHVRFALESTGLAALLVDRFRFENAHASRLFDGEYDHEIIRQAGVCTSPRCIRSYVNDEPEYSEWEAWRYVDSLITARLGRRAITALYWGVDREMVRRWALDVRPSEILIDPYPFAGSSPLALPELPGDAPALHGIPPYERGTYDNEVRAALDQYVDDLDGARQAARLAGVELWLVLQAHGIARVRGNSAVPPGVDMPRPSGRGTLVYDFRPPTPAELRAMAFLGVAHGARAFFHFLYKSLDTCGYDDCRAYVGLVGPNHERLVDRIYYKGAAPLNELWTGYDSRWEAARTLNQRLATILRALEGWEDVAGDPRSSGPAGTQRGLVSEHGAPATDVHVGVFARVSLAGGGARFIIVNRRCGPEDERALTLRLAPSEATRTITDVESGRTLALVPAGGGSFSITLGPGDARLLEVSAAPGSTDARHPVEAAIRRIRPNPVAGAAVIDLAVPTPTHVRAVLHDVLGREIIVVFEGPLDAGFHELSWSASHVPSGVYALRIRVGDRTLSSRVTVAR